MPAPLSPDAWLAKWACRTTPDLVTGCWPWPGAVRADGYGVTVIRQRPRLPHVVVHELLLGPIPDGYQVDHVWSRGCRDKSCWWVGHLEAVTALENVHRRDARLAEQGRGRGRSHCDAGHEYTPENTRLDARGVRICRVCRAGYERARRVRLKLDIPVPDPLHSAGP